jgi:hypothetical protein
MAVSLGKHTQTEALSSVITAIAKLLISLISKASSEVAFQQNLLLQQV